MQEKPSFWRIVLEKGGDIMADQTVRLQTLQRQPADIATEITIAMIEKGQIIGVKDVVAAFQKIYDTANHAHENSKNPNK